MLNQENPEETDNIVLLQKNRNKKTAKLLFILFLLFYAWIITLLLSIYQFNMGYRWAFLNLDQWITTAIILTAVFILIQLILLVQYQSLNIKSEELKKPRPVFIHGKKIVEYTVPKNSKGGFFSKTYIPIDECNTLQLRTQVIPPKDLWTKK